MGQTTSRQGEMAEAGWVKPPRRAHQGSAVQGRDQTNQTRRMMSPSPTFGHSSLLARIGLAFERTYQLIGDGAFGALMLSDLGIIAGVVAVALTVVGAMWWFE